jgi:hypothetical protein
MKTAARHCRGRIEAAANRAASDSPQRPPRSRDSKEPRGTERIDGRAIELHGVNPAESVALRNKSLREEIIVFFSAEKTRRR